MSEALVDPGLFRLRRFEEEWIAPLAGDPENYDPLNVLLLAEAQAWVSVGQLLGYFAPHQTDMPAPPSVLPSVTPVIGWIQTRGSPPPRLRTDTFATELSDAREDLTAEKRELLQRVLFGSDEEWAQAIAGLDGLVLLLGDRADATAADLAEVAWALETESVSRDEDGTSFAVLLPGGWRAGELRELAQLVPHTAGRIEELLRVRGAIAQMLADRYLRSSTELVLAEPSRPLPDVRETVHAHAQAALHARWLAGQLETAPERLAEFGVASVAAYLHRHDWIHRGSESVACSTDEELTILRRLRIDFTIPGGLAPVDSIIVNEGGPPEFYVPVSMIPKALPTAKLELRSASGELLPVLTRDQNGVIDAAVFVALAEHSAGDVELSDELREDLAWIPRGDPRDAYEMFRRLLSRWSSQEDARERLPDDPVFFRTAQDLVDSAILWARIKGWPGERGVVELSYNLPTDLQLPWYSPEGLGWRALNVAIDLPHVGEGNYHLEIDVPHSVRVVYAQVDVAERSSLGRGTDKRLRAAASESAPRFVAGRLGGRQTSIDVASASGNRVLAWVSLLAEKSSIRFAFLASLLNTALLIALYIDRNQIVGVGQSSAAAVAFVAPIAAAVLAMRGVQSPLAAALLGGVRRLTGTVVVLSLLGAVTLILTTRRDLFTFDIIWEVLLVLSAMISLLLLASSSLPSLRPQRKWDHEGDLHPGSRYWDAVEGTIEKREAEPKLPTAA